MLPCYNNLRITITGLNDVMISVCGKCKKQCFDTDKYYCELEALKKKYNELKEHNNKLKEAFDFVMNVSHDILTLRPQQISIIPYNITRINRPLNVNYKDDLIYWRFITITFDPNKFGLNNDPLLEKQYILHSLIDLNVKYKHYDQFYGCFEYQKNGAVHSHVLMRILDNGPLKKDLKKYYTDNSRNEHAVKVDYAKYPNALNYINKIGIKEEDRGDEWFYYNPTTAEDLDYGIVH